MSTYSSSSSSTTIQRAASVQHVGPGHDKEMEDFLEMVHEALSRPALTEGPPPEAPPPWLDMDKFRRGKRFALEHICGIFVAEVMSLFLLFAYPNSLQALISTGRSDTPGGALRRYISTARKVLVWYEGDVWTEGDARREVRAVRSLHAAVQQTLRSTAAKDLPSRTTLAGKLPPGATPVVDAGLFRLDMEASPLTAPLAAFPDTSYPRCCPLNQGEMGMTQFGFLGLFLLHPGSFGASVASPEDLDALAHFWRGVGFLMGVEDRFNVCDGDIGEVRDKCQKIVDVFLKPSLRVASRDWEHMSRCMSTGLRRYVPFEVLLLQLCLNVLGIPAPRLAASLGWAGYLQLKLWDFFLGTVLSLGPSRRLFNWLLTSLLHLAGQRAKASKPAQCPYKQILLPQGLVRTQW